MAVYKYRGVYKNNIVKGTIHGQNFGSALTTLRSIAIKPISMATTFLIYRMQDEEFYRWMDHLIMLLSHGFNIKQSMIIMSENNTLSKQIALFTSHNRPFTEAIENNSHFLPKNFSHMINVMIKFTTIEEALRFFLDFHNTTVKDIKNKIRPLYWSIMQLFISLLILLIVSCIGQHVMQPLADELNTQLPYFFHIFDHVRLEHLAITCFIILLVIYMRLWQRIRFIRELHMHIYCYTVFSFIGHAMQKGVPIKEAVIMSMNITPTNHCLLTIYKNLLRGNTVYESFEYAKITKAQCEMMRVAEKSGCIERGFRMSAEVSAYQINQRVSTISRVVRYFAIYTTCAMMLYIFIRGFLAITFMMLEQCF